MIENIKYKVADVAKDLKLPVKDIVDTLSEKFPAKKAQTVLTEQELNYVFEHYTKEKEVTSFASYFAMANQPKEEPKIPSRRKKKQKKLKKRIRLRPRQRKSLRKNPRPRQRKSPRRNPHPRRSKSRRRKPNPSRSAAPDLNPYTSRSAATDRKTITVSRAAVSATSPRATVSRATVSVTSPRATVSRADASATSLRATASRAAASATNPISRKMTVSAADLIKTATTAFIVTSRKSPWSANLVPATFRPRKSLRQAPPMWI